MATETLEVPPRNSILSADDGCVGSEHRLQVGSKLGETVRLYAQENNVSLPCLVERADNPGLCLKISLDAPHSHTMFLHRS